LNSAREAKEIHSLWS